MLLSLLALTGSLKRLDAPHSGAAHTYAVSQVTPQSDSQTALGRTLRIDRWYDQVPDWWDNPVEERLDVDGLVRRLYDRGPEWQPSYLEKLYTSAR